MSEIIFKTWRVLFESSPGKWISAIVGISILFTSYLLISRTIVYNSDNASIVLEAQAMRQGNYVLRGWYVPTDNFLTIEIPLYALGLLLGFSMTSLLHIIPALLYTLVVISGGYLASTLLQGKQRLWGLLAFLGIVAFPPLDMVQRLLVGPIHMGTIVLILVGLIAYRRFLTAGRGKRTAFTIVLLMIVLLIVGDPFALVLFVLPLILTEGIQMLVKRRVSSQESFMISAVLLAVILSFGIRWILEVAGVHILISVVFLLTTIPGMASNFVSAIIFLYTIFHANIFTRSSFPLTSFPLFINAFALSALVYAAVRWCIRSLFHTATTGTKLISVLIWGSIGILAAFTVSTLGGPPGTRYLFPILFFTGIVSFSITFPFIRKCVLIVAIILVFVMNATLFAVSLYQAPAASGAEAQLITLLEKHHLARGLGTYWVAPMVTVRSEGRVVIRQVTNSNHQLHPYLFLADEKWFDASNLRSANFIVYRDSDDPQAYYDASVQSFGFPDHQYKTGIYTILVWNSPLSTHMRPGYTF